MAKLMNLTISSDGWMKFNTKEEWDFAYPQLVYGKYIPQPYRKPYKFPCYVNEIMTICRDDGPDEIVHCFIYDFKEAE